MSGFFGIFNRNGILVEEKTVNTMLDAMSYWSPDDKGTYIEGSVALGHAMLWNTPESKYEHLPLEKDTYILTMDARIDNRDELAKEIELPDRPMEEIGDSKFILAAYQKWGEDCPKYLLGDFAFAIWDEKKQQLFCARDHVGVKPFYYFVNNDLFVFSNDIRAIITHSNVPQIYDDKMILSYLYELEQPKITFFKDIKRLSPSTSIVITKKYSKEEIFWKPEDMTVPELKSLDEYSAQLRDLLDDAVRVRLRSDYKMASHLSGGLDSSSIAVIASRNLKKENKRLFTFSWLHSPEENDDKEHFEWSNGECISKIEGILYHYIQMNIDVFRKVFKIVDIRHMNRLDFWNEYRVREDAKNEGIRTILSGWGGDELISYNGGKSFNAELFWQGKILLSLKSYRKETGKARYPFLSFVKKMIKELVLPLFSKKYFDALYNYISTSFYSDTDPLAIMSDDFIKRSKSIDFLPHHQDRKLGKRTEQLNRYYVGTIQNRLESWASSGTIDRIEYRYPLLDKRIVEFALNIPLELFKQNGITRYLYRYTLKGLIPEDIIWSDTKFENERSDKYNFLQYDFLKEWYGMNKNNKHLYNDNLFIDRNAFLNYLKQISESEMDIDNIELIKRMMIASKAIYLLKF